MRKVLLLAMALFFVADTWADAQEINCADKVCTTACHTVCQTHMAPDHTSAVSIANTSENYVMPQNSQIYTHLLSKSLFRPPRFTA